MARLDAESLADHAEQDVIGATGRAPRHRHALRVGAKGGHEIGDGPDGRVRRDDPHMGLADQARDRYCLGDADRAAVDDGGGQQGQAAELHRDLARAIIEHLRASAAEPGQVLSESGLAPAVGTSRSPVRGALQVLLKGGVVERRDDGRLLLVRLPAAGEEVVPPDGEAGAAERLYWRIAADRVAGTLPDLVGEAGLMRRYEVPRGVVHRVLLQIMGEGWIERAFAGGWRFLIMIDGPGSYDESYRFHRAIEPAAPRAGGAARARRRPARSARGVRNELGLPPRPDAGLEQPLLR